MTEAKRFVATASFGITDIKDYANCTTDEADEWLDRNFKYIQEAMVVAGWNAIDTLVSLDPPGGK